MIRRLLPAALALLLLCSCASNGNGFDVTETITPEQIRTMIAEAEESLRAAETTAPPTTAEDTTFAAPIPNDSATVYWSPSGGVWHTIPDCSALRQAKTVLSGSVIDAMAAGKARVCKTCGN